MSSPTTIEENIRWYLTERLYAKQTGENAYKLPDGTKFRLEQRQMTHGHRWECRRFNLDGTNEVLDIDWGHEYYSSMPGGGC